MAILLMTLDEKRRKRQRKERGKRRKVLAVLTVLRPKTKIRRVTEVVRVIRLLIHRVQIRVVVTRQIRLKVNLIQNLREVLPL